MVDKIVEQNLETLIVMTVMTEAGTGLEKGSFSRNYGNYSSGSKSNSRSRSGSRATTNRDRIGCYKCKEYDHFTKDCPTSREEKEIEQLQQMLNLQDEQTSLTPSISNMQVNFSRMGSEESIITGHLNL